MMDDPRPPEPDPAPLDAVPPQPPIDNDPLFWTYTDIALFAGAALPCLLLGYGLVKLVLWIARVKAPAEALVLLPAQALGYLLLFGVLFLIFRMYGRPFWRSLAWVEPSWSAPLIAGAGFLVAIAVVVLGNLIRTPEAENEITKLMKDPISLALMAVFGVLIAPLCEELAFRGFLQPLLVRSFGPVTGILGAAIPFGLLHFGEYNNSWRHALLIALAGAAFGWMRHKTRSTLASTVMHAAYNALFFAAFFAARNSGRL